MEKNAKTILELAAKTGVCRTGRRYLKSTPKDTDTLIKILKGWPEYLQEHGDLAVKILRENMDADIDQRLRQSNIFLDFEGKATIDNDTAVMLLGKSNVSITTKPFAVCKIYLFNDSISVITPGDNSIVDVETWHHSSAGITVNATAKTIGRQYDGTQIIGAGSTTTEHHARGEVFNGKETNHIKK